MSAYKKGPKVLVQGKETASFLEKVLGLELKEQSAVQKPSLGSDKGMFEPHFGIDESGKGDFFGPLVVAGVYTDEPIAKTLLRVGVMDSKAIGTAAKIRKLAAEIRKVEGIAYDVIVIRPERYNEIYGAFRNLNRMLAWGHAEVIHKLAGIRPDCPRALSDQFARAEVLEAALAKKQISLKLEQRTKGESDIAVAAASILAREAFINWMDAASRKLGVTLPLGASSRVVKAGRELVTLKGEEFLGKLGKTHFKTRFEIMR